MRSAHPGRRDVVAVAFLTCALLLGALCSSAMAEERSTVGKEAHRHGLGRSDPPDLRLLAVHRHDGWSKRRGDREGWRRDHV